MRVKMPTHDGPQAHQQPATTSPSSATSAVATTGEGKRRARALRAASDARDRHGNRAFVRRTAVLENENPLPCAKLHFAVRDRDRLRGASEHHADVDRKSVAPLGRVQEIILVFWNEPVEPGLEIRPRA